MRRLRAIATDQRGMALVLGLVALLTLSALMLAYVSVSAFEPRIAANLAAATQARYLAEAGVEAAFDGLAGLADWTIALAGATCALGAIAPATMAGSALPGLPGAAGSFTARVRNDCLAGSARDRLLTGLADEDRGGATTDTNHHLVIESTGTAGNASRTITAVVRKIVLPPINAALAFPGTGVALRLSGAGMTISGADTRMGSDAAGAASPVLGIALGQAASVAGVDTALAAHPETRVMGKNDRVSGTTGTRSVAHDATLTSAAVAQFVKAIKHAADITPTGPAAIRNMGAGCTWHDASSVCWGTAAQPKVVHVKGDGAVALTVSGDSRGTGILVVEDGALEIGGTFRWHGPVIVAGRGAAVRFRGDEAAAIWGSLVVDDTASGLAALESEGAGRRSISYSAEAIDTVLRGLGARRFMSLAGWQER